MKRCQFALALVLIFLGAPANAFEECHKLPDASALRESISRLIVLWTPARYFEELQAIQLLMPERSDALTPYAAFDTHGQPIVVVSLEFYSILCRFVLATSYIAEHPTSDVIDPVRNEIARCLQRGERFRACLNAYALALDKQFESQYAVISDDDKSLNELILSNALGQIVLHEYAHFFFDHHQRIQRGEIKRIDAEFEADFFAITQSAENVAYPWAMAYFFKTMSGIEFAAHSSSEEYENSYCRRENVVAIGDLYDAIPVQMINLVLGHKQHFTREDYASNFGKFMHTSTPAFDKDRCSKLSTSYLRQAHAELVAIYQRLYADVDWLLQQDQNVWPGGLPANASVIALQRDLLNMAASFQRLNSLAATLASMVTRRIGLHEPKTVTLPFVQSLLANATVAQSMPSSDYGRLLGEYGLALVYTPSADSKSRLQEVKRVFLNAVQYNPALTESWYHLGFVALIEGDCSSAADRMAKAVETCTSEDARPLFEHFAENLRVAARNGKCSAWSAQASEDYQSRKRTPRQILEDAQ